MGQTLESAHLLVLLVAVVLLLVLLLAVVLRLVLLLVLRLAVVLLLVLRLVPLLETHLVGVAVDLPSPIHRRGHRHLVAVAVGLLLEGWLRSVQNA